MFSRKNILSYLLGGLMLPTLMFIIYYGQGKEINWIEIFGYYLAGVFGIAFMNYINARSLREKK